MNRRNALKVMGIGALAGAVPAVPFAVSDQTSEVIGPVLLERTCDHNKDSYTPEEIAKMDESLKHNPWRWGCGTRFRWYLGVSCVCPKCGWHYLYTNEMLAQKKFWVNNGTRA